MTSRERNILYSTCFGHFMSHFNMLVFPALVIPLSRRLNMQLPDVLGLSFWMYLLFGLTALFWGMAADRRGAGPLLLLFFLGSCVGGFAAAFWVDSPVLLMLSLAGIGLFSGIYHPVGLGLISKEIQRVSVGMGYNGMFGNLGLATAPLITGLVNWLWGVRAVYLVLALLNMIGVFLMTFFPMQLSRESGSAASASEKSDAGAFLILLVAMMLGGVVYRGGTLILPAYFELRNPALFQLLHSVGLQGVSNNLIATAAVSLVFVIGMLGQYTGGRIAERFNLLYSYLFFHTVTIPVACILGISWNAGLLIYANVYFFFLLGMQPIENTLVAGYTPRQYHHSAYGTKFVLTFGVGAAAVKMVEWIDIRWGLAVVFPTLGGVSLLLCLTIVILIGYTRKGKR